MVVEELLKLLVDKVDGDLLESVVLKDLKASNIKHSTEVGLLESGGIQSKPECSVIFQLINIPIN